MPTGGNVGYGAAANVGRRRRARPPGCWSPTPTSASGPARWTSCSTRPRSGRRPAPGGRRSSPRTATCIPARGPCPRSGRGIGHALAGWWWPSNPWTATYRREREDPVEGEAGWLSGSCLLLRRAAFEQVAGFDPSYFMYFEDVDLCDRLGRAGWASVYVPRRRRRAPGGHATKRSPRPMLRAHHSSAYRYLSRRYPGLRATRRCGRPRARPVRPVPALAGVPADRRGSGADPVGRRAPAVRSRTSPGSDQLRGWVGFVGSPPVGEFCGGPGVTAD